jgi:hypothetical protein
VRDHGKRWNRRKARERNQAGDLLASQNHIPLHHIPLLVGHHGSRMRMGDNMRSNVLSFRSGQNPK